jgi:hypothetical protein
MAPITINRNPWTALIDDSGQNLDGSLWDKAAIKGVLLDPIDAALAAVPVDAATGKILDSALSTNVAKLATAQTFTQANNFNANVAVYGQLSALGANFSVGASTPAYIDGGLILRSALNMRDSPAGGPLLFPATQNASTDPNGLDDYEEGVWTPTDGSGAGLAFTTISAAYVKNGQMVTLACAFTYPTTAHTAGATVGGLPFPVSAIVASAWGGAMGYTTISQPALWIGIANATIAQCFTNAGAAIQNSAWSGRTCSFSMTYRAAG